MENNKLGKQQIEDKGKVENGNFYDNEDETLKQNNDVPVVKEPKQWKFDFEKLKLLRIKTYRIRQFVSKKWLDRLVTQLETTATGIN